MGQFVVRGFAIALLVACAGSGGYAGSIGGRLDRLDPERPQASRTTSVLAVRDSEVSDIRFCRETFPVSGRDRWHAFDGEFYYIDALGRPSRAYAYLPPLTVASRQSACQSAVGRWGDDEQPSDDYDGGHLIGSQLGGYGGRLNLVPQDLNFNRGNWAQIENKMAQCQHLPNAILFYYVRVNYAGADTLVPETWTLIIENRDTRENVKLRFENSFRGGVDGIVQRDQAVQFLDDQGCRP